MTIENSGLLQAFENQSRGLCFRDFEKVRTCIAHICSSN